MKILFFRNHLSYKKADNYVGTGWISSYISYLKVHSENALHPHELAIAFFSDEVKTLTTYTDNGVTLFIIPSYVRRLDKGRRNLALTDFLYKERLPLILDMISAYKPDIIHVFGTENPFGLLAKEVSIPLIVHIQGILNPYLEKIFPSGYNVWDFVRSTSVPRIVMFSGMLGYYLKFRKLALREAEIFKYVEHFSGRTNWDRRVTRILSGTSSSYYHCDEVLRDAFYHTKWRQPSPSQKIRIISVINPDPYKGLETIFKTMKLLMGGGKYNFEWSIAGMKADSALVKMFVRKTRLDPNQLNVRFCGPMQESELIEELLSSDLFVHPSHIENSPNSLCEAMILGMPIICTSVGGVQSLLADGIEGILTQDQEPYSLAGAICDLVDSPAMAVTMGQAARKRALERHDPAKIISTTLAIYEKVILSRNEGKDRVPAAAEQ